MKKIGMDYGRACDIFKETLADYENGVNISKQAEAMLVFALDVLRAFDQCEEEANLQADREFNDNPEQPKARMACEKLAKVMARMGECARRELFSPVKGDRAELVADSSRFKP